jgi:hypothetical protein
MVADKRLTDKKTPRTGDRRLNVFELTSGETVPVGAIFLTDFAEPVPKEVSGRVELLFDLFAQIPKDWLQYVDLVLARPEVFTKVYEAIYEGKRKRVRIKPSDFDLESIVKVMMGPLNAALARLPSPPFMVFVFPRFFSSLAVDGHCVSSQAVHLFIDPKGNWKHELPPTLCHEFFHLAYRNLHPGKHNGADTMIDEALGMHFAEAITGHRYYRRPEMTDALAKAWLRKKRRILEKGAHDVFYAKNIQPEGFYCGYALVRPLLDSMKDRPDKWRAVAALPTKDVFGIAYKLFVGGR